MPWSHPSRVRGLKLIADDGTIALTNVAPFAGAWIETLPFTYLSIMSLVAPFAGAWIETPYGITLRE